MDLCPADSSNSFIQVGLGPILILSTTPAIYLGHPSVSEISTVIFSFDTATEIIRMGGTENDIYHNVVHMDEAPCRDVDVNAYKCVIFDCVDNEGYRSFVYLTRSTNGYMDQIYIMYPDMMTFCYNVSEIK